MTRQLQCFRLVPAAAALLIAVAGAPEAPVIAADVEAVAASSEAAPAAERKVVRKKGEISFDDLKLDIEKDGVFKKEMLTDEIKAYDKQTLKIKGYILPTSVFQQKGIKQFVLVRDNKECCFGPGAAIHDAIMVEMVGDASADFTTRPITVAGKFQIDTETFRYPEGKHFAIYKIAGTAVE